MTPIEMYWTTRAAFKFVGWPCPSMLCCCSGSVRFEVTDRTILSGAISTLESPSRRAISRWELFTLTEAEESSGRLCLSPLRLPACLQRPLHLKLSIIVMYSNSMMPPQFLVFTQHLRHSNLKGESIKAIFFHWSSSLYVCRSHYRYSPFSFSINKEGSGLSSAFFPFSIFKMEPGLSFLSMDSSNNTL